MAVRFDATTDLLSRTTNLPSATAHTLMAWAYAVTIPGSGQLGAVLSIGVAPISGNFYGIGFSNNRLGIYNANGGAVNATGATGVATATWYHITQTVAGTGANQMIGYLNGVQELTTTSAASFTATTLFVGHTAGDDTLNGRVAAVKIYGAVLTAEEIKAEMRTYLPLRLTNLLSWHPLLLHTDTAQYGTTWTTGGTLTTEVGPPIAWTRPAVRGYPWSAAVVAPGFWRPPVIITQAVRHATL